VAAADDKTYWRHVRSEIEPLLAGAPARILEIGCGAGHTLAWLKRRWPTAETVGVDGWQDIAGELKRNADVALIQDLNDPLPDLGQFDLILALDVLEHLRDPQAVMDQLVGMLNPDGAVIVSVPNIANVWVIADLVFHRRFEYRDAGVLDRTHLHFFTEQSALALLQSAGLRVVNGVINGLARKRSRLLLLASLGLARHYLVEQYIMRGVRGAPARSVPWRASK
jgi:2-polyprenyl-3-methyl-5-hydroxy-6-metoxy-1,4-benzoquinol methylase